MTGRSDKAADEDWPAHQTTEGPGRPTRALPKTADITGGHHGESYAPSG